MTTQLRLESEVIYENGTMTIDNAACVPHVGSTMSTLWGIREVKSLHYDFHEYTGQCCVTVTVDRSSAKE
jgi:hypothetical protein